MKTFKMIKFQWILIWIKLILLKGIMSMEVSVQTNKKKKKSVPKYSDEEDD